MEVLPQMTCPRNWTADYLFGSDILFLPVFAALSSMLAITRGDIGY